MNVLSYFYAGNTQVEDLSNDQVIDQNDQNDATNIDLSISQPLPTIQLPQPVTLTQNINIDKTIHPESTKFHNITPISPPPGLQITEIINSNIDLIDDDSEKTHDNHIYNNENKKNDFDYLYNNKLLSLMTPYESYLTSILNFLPQNVEQIINTRIPLNNPRVVVLLLGTGALAAHYISKYFSDHYHRANQLSIFQQCKALVYSQFHTQRIVIILQLSKLESLSRFSIPVLRQLYAFFSHFTSYRDFGVISYSTFTEQLLTDSLFTKVEDTEQLQDPSHNQQRQQSLERLHNNLPTLKHLLFTLFDAYDDKQIDFIEFIHMMHILYNPDTSYTLKTIFQRFIFHNSNNSYHTISNHNVYSLSVQNETSYNDVTNFLLYNNFCSDLNDILPISESFVVLNSLDPYTDHSSSQMAHYLRIHTSLLDTISSEQFATLLTNYCIKTFGNNEIVWNIDWLYNLAGMMGLQYDINTCNLYVDINDDISLFGDSL